MIDYAGKLRCKDCDRRMVWVSRPGRTVTCPYCLDKKGQTHNRRVKMWQDAAKVEHVEYVTRRPSTAIVKDGRVNLREYQAVLDAIKAAGIQQQAVWDAGVKALDIRVDA